jgi:type IV secretion system protein TrbL
MAPDQAIATKIMNSLLFVLTGGMARSLPATVSLMHKLIIIEIILMGVYIALGHRHAAAMMVSKLLWLSVLTLFIRNWGYLARIFMESLVQNGLDIGGGVITLDAFLDPGQIMRYGLEIIGVVFTRLTSYSGIGALYAIPSLIIMGFAAFGVWFAFFIIAGQVFISVLMFYLSVAVTLILLPFGAFRHTAFIAEKAFAIVISSGISLGVLAVVTSMALPFLITLQISPDPTFAEVFTILGAAGLLALLAYHAPAVAAGIFTGAPALAAAELAGATSAAAGGILTGAQGISQVTRQAIGASRQGINAARRFTTRHGSGDSDRRQAPKG